MKRIIIHIGTHKTGTTAFQKSLVNERKKLEAAGIHFEWMQMDYDKHSIAYEHIGGPDATDRSREEFLQMAIAALRERDTLILSEEGLTEPGPIFAETLAPLKQHAEITIVCALRPQYEYLEKLWAQRIREKHTKLSIEEFTETGNSVERCKYHKILQYWADCFGQENLRVLDYSKMELDSPNMILKAANVDFRFSKRLPPQNRTPSSHKVRLMEYLNSIGAAYVDEDILNSRYQADAPSELSLMTYGHKCKIDARYKAENDKLRRQFGIGFAPPQPCETVGPLTEEEFCHHFPDGFRPERSGLLGSLLFRTGRIIDKYVFDRIGGLGKLQK